MPIRTDDPAILGVAWAVGPTEIRWQLIDSMTFGLNYLRTAEEGSVIYCTLMPLGYQALADSQRRPLGFGNQV